MKPRQEPDVILNDFNNSKAKYSITDEDRNLFNSYVGYGRTFLDKNAREGNPFSLAALGGLCLSNKVKDEERAYQYFNAAIARFAQSNDMGKGKEYAGIMANYIARFVPDEEKKLEYHLRAMRYGSEKSYDEYSVERNSRIRLEIEFAYYIGSGGKNSNNFYKTIDHALDSQLQSFFEKRSKTELEQLQKIMKREKYVNLQKKAVEDIKKMLENEVLSNALKSNNNAEYPRTRSHIEENIKQAIEKIKAKNYYHLDYISELNVDSLVKKQIKEIENVAQSISYDVSRNIEIQKGLLVAEMESLLEKNNIRLTGDLVSTVIDAMTAQNTTDEGEAPLARFIHKNSKANSIALQLKAFKDVEISFKAAQHNVSPSAPPRDDEEPGSPQVEGVEKKPDELPHFNQLLPVIKAIEQADQELSKKIKDADPTAWKEFTKIVKTAAASLLLIGIPLMLRSYAKYGTHQFWSKSKIAAAKARASLHDTTEDLTNRINELPRTRRGG